MQVRLTNVCMWTFLELEHSWQIKTEVFYKKNHFGRHGTNSNHQFNQCTQINLITTRRIKQLKRQWKENRQRLRWTLTGMVFIPRYVNESLSSSILCLHRSRFNTLELHEKSISLLQWTCLTNKTGSGVAPSLKTLHLNHHTNFNYQLLSNNETIYSVIAVTDEPTP